MSLYSILVFLHILGAVGLFAAIGIETVIVGRLKRADTPAAARIWVGLASLPQRLSSISSLALLVTGIWMTVKLWGHQPWIASAFFAMIVMGATAGIVIGRRVKLLRLALPAV
jgi:hypothetical protein